LLKKCAHKEYRDSLSDEHVNTWLAFQIKSLREKRGWSQEQLGQKTGMAQARISLMENPDYSRYTLTTLRRIAHAFDVALDVRFKTFGHVIDSIVNLSPEDYQVASYSANEPMPRRTIAGTWGRDMGSRKYVASIRTNGNDSQQGTPDLFMLNTHQRSEHQGIEKNAPLGSIAS
jgi:transcriptional regulator with XRE-family HTH domain